MFWSPRIAKKGCLKASLVVILWLGSLINIFLQRSMQLLLTAENGCLVLKFGYSYLIILKVWRFSDDWNGRDLQTMRYMMTPSAHTSTSLWYGYFSKTSGATYAGVPQLSITGSRLDTILDNPKSVILTCFTFWHSYRLPSSSTRIFSGLMSLCRIPQPCRYWTPSRSYFKI